ncbi:MAG: c-type cytochrome [Deltaproteobacteria bacterium]|nr:c-type cytochrome [Deltaproteobacteria bacterium]
MKTFSFFPLLITIFLLPFHVYASGTHAVGHSHDDTHLWQAPADMAERINPIEKTHESIQRGKDLYKKYCALCHGPEAKGDGPAAGSLKQKPTDLASMAGKHQDGDFSWKIANGRGPMPGWQETLTEKQIWDIVNFIQNL